MANEQAITGPSPAHYMNNDSRRGFLCAIIPVELALHWNFRDGRPDRHTDRVRAFAFAACHRREPKNERRLRLIATFWLN